MNAVSPRRHPSVMALAVLAVGLAGRAPVVRAEPSTPGTAGTAVAAAAATAAEDHGPGPSLGGAAIGTDNLPENGNPYRAIVARNAFRLKDPLPPPPPPTNAPPAAEPPKIDVKLAGVGVINGVRWAYLMIPDATRPGQFYYPSLTDDPKRGDTRHGGVEVREIDVKKQFVRVVNGGLEASLNFKDNGVKAMPAAPAAGKPGSGPGAGGPGVNMGKPTTTMVVPAAGTPPTPGAGQHEEQPVVFSRSRSRASVDNAGGGTGGGVAVPAGGGGISGTPNVNFPTRPVRSDTANPAVVSAPVIPLEHQYEVLLKQKQAYEAVGVPLPPIPGLPQAPAPQQ